MRALNKKNRKLTDDLHIHKHIIEHDAYDIYVFDDIKKHNPKIKKTEDEGLKNYPQFKELHQDLFDALYKYAPKKVPESEISYTHLLNSEVIDAILESKQYKELRSLTRLDSIASTVGTEVMGEEVKKIIEELVDKFKELEEQMKSAAADMGGSGVPSDEENEGKDKTDQPGNAKGKEAIKYEEAQRRLEEYMKQVKQLIDKKERRAIAKMVENAANQSRATSELISNWGLNASDSFIKSNYQDKLKLLDRLRNSRKLKQIAEMAGRYKRLALQTQREKVKRGMDEVYDIIPGRDLGRLLASEKMKLLLPLTAKLFKKDLLEGKVLQYETSGKEKKHKGAVVICIDDSGKNFV